MGFEQQLLVLEVGFGCRGRNRGEGDVLVGLYCQFVLVMFVGCINIGRGLDLVRGLQVFSFCIDYVLDIRLVFFSLINRIFYLENYDGESSKEYLIFLC